MHRLTRIRGEFGNYKISPRDANGSTPNQQLPAISGLRRAAGTNRKNEPIDFKSKRAVKSLHNMELPEIKGILEITTSRTQPKLVHPKSSSPGHSGAAARRGIEPRHPAGTDRKNEPSNFKPKRAVKPIKLMELSETNAISELTTSPTPPKANAASSPSPCLTTPHPGTSPTT